MKVYIFDENTKEYLWENDAFIEPLGGSPLAPSNGTFIPPHSILPRNCAQIFNRFQERWDIVPDYRRQQIFNTSTHQFEVISKLGELDDNQFIIDDDTKTEYSAHPEFFVIANGKINRKSDDEISAIIVDNLKKLKRQVRNNFLKDTDWKVQRSEDRDRLGLSQIEDTETLSRYRQYLRDFTNQKEWWTDNNPIKSIEEFINSGENI